MRSLLITAALLTCPASVLADDFDAADRSLGTPAPVDTWQLDDGDGVAELPWDDYDSGLSYAPRGGLHWGLEGRVGLVPSESLTTSIRPQLEVFGYADVRYAHRSPWRLRIGIALGVEPFQTTNLGGGTITTSSVLSLRLRILPMSVDLGPNFGLRAGGDIGIQVTPGADGPDVLFDGAGILQLVGRPDDGKFEIGAYTGIRVTGVDRIERANFRSDGSGTSFVPDALVGLSAGYLF